MTVQYYHQVLTAGPVVFLKLLIRWKGSIFKLLCTDFFIFSMLYSIISIIHRFVLGEDTKRKFETLVTYVSDSQSLISVAFIVGFFVNLVFSRFWQHFNTIPWISKISLLVSTFIQDPDFGTLSVDKIEEEKEKTRLEKRTIIRYLMSSLLITLSRISVPVKKRFHNIDELTKKEILLDNETELIKKTEPYTMQPFLPILWGSYIVIKANNEGRIPNESLVIGMIEEINKFRQLLLELFLLDQICVPLVYTQIVTLVIYSYFLSCLIGRQFILYSEDANNSKDFIIPTFTIIQFLVYIGWIKLALTLVNPIGEDDEDFDLNSFIDYNIQTGISSVETLKLNQPPLEKDYFFNSNMYKLPLQEKSNYAQQRPFRGSFCEMRMENDDWVTSIKSLLNLSASDREIVQEGINKNPNSISLPKSPRMCRKLPIFPHMQSISGLLTVTPEKELTEQTEIESVFRNKKKSTEKKPLLIIEEEEQGIGSDIKIIVSGNQAD